MRPAAWQRTWLLVALLCALGFVALAAVVNGQGSVWFDAQVIDVVRGLPVPPDIWLAITQAGGTILTVVGAGLVLWLLAKGRIQLAVIVGLALLAGTFATDLIKLGIARPRPPGDPLVGAVGYSFPSGHTLNSTVTYGLVALVTWRGLAPLRIRRLVVIGLAVLVVLVGLSRIALGVHYPSDVLAGWLGGMAIVATVAAVPAIVFFARWSRAPAPAVAASPGSPEVLPPRNE